MKKIVSLALAGLMSLSLFAIGASADEAKTNETPVGANGGALANEFNDEKTGSSDINVKVDTVIHKYAVDITYKFEDLSLGQIKWDVDDLKYVVDTTADAANQAQDTTRSLTIKNRSDMPVDATIAVADKNNADHLSFSVKAPDTDGNDFTGEKTVTIAKATTGNAVEVPVTFDVKPVDGKTWNDVVEYYGPKFAHEENNTTVKFVFATVTVTLTKSAN